MGKWIILFFSFMLSSISIHAAPLTKQMAAEFRKEVGGICVKEMSAQVGKQIPKKTIQDYCSCRAASLAQSFTQEDLKKDKIDPKDPRIAAANKACVNKLPNPAQNTAFQSGVNACIKQVKAQTGGKVPAADIKNFCECQIGQLDKLFAKENAQNKKIDPKDPRIEAAQRACISKLPAPSSQGSNPSMQPTSRQDVINACIAQLNTQTGGKLTKLQVKSFCECQTGQLEKLFAKDRPQKNNIDPRDPRFEIAQKACINRLGPVRVQPVNPKK